MKVFMVLMNYVHLISVFTLFGIIIFFRIISTPLMRKIEPQDHNAVPLLVGAGEKVVFFGWIFIFVIAINGLVMMFMDSHYQGFMVIDRSDPWTIFMFVKHISYGVLILSFTAYTLLVKKNKALLDQNLSTRQAGKAMDFFALCNMLLGLFIMACTAIAHHGYQFELVVPATLHTLLLAAWIGGLFFVNFIGTPLIQGKIVSQELEIVEGLYHMQMVANRFIKLLWTAIFVSIFSGFSMIFLSDRFANFLRSFEGPNLIVTIKIVVFLMTITGAFVVTPAIARLGVKISQASKLTNVTQEVLEDILKERAIISNGARAGFIALQILLIITTILMVS